MKINGNDGDDDENTFKGGASTASTYVRPTHRRPEMNTARLTPTCINQDTRHSATLLTETPESSL